MKSPNAKESVRQLKMAVQMLKTAREDLKNDPEVRGAKIHTGLQAIEYEIEAMLSLLRTIGYQ